MAGWNPVALVQVLVLFVLAGFAEIGGGWCVWATVRERRSWRWAVLGTSPSCKSVQASNVLANETEANVED